MTYLYKNSRGEYKQHIKERLLKTNDHRNGTTSNGSCCPCCRMRGTEGWPVGGAEGHWQRCSMLQQLLLLHYSRCLFPIYRI